MVAERDSLRAIGAEPSKELAGQLDSLRQEKAALEKALADEKERLPRLLPFLPNLLLLLLLHYTISHPSL